MPPSLLQDRVDAAWPAIKKAVEAGLAFTDGTKIQDVFPTAGTNTNAWQWGPWTTTPAGRRRTAAAGSDPVIAHEHRYTVQLHDLLDPPAAELKTWAESAREFELTDVIAAAIAAAQTVPLGPPLPAGAVPMGWGQPRFVHWGLPAADVALLSTVAEGHKISVPQPNLGGVRALLFRLGGGPSIALGSDLSLGWLPAPDGIEIVLNLDLSFAKGSAVVALL